MPTDLGSQNRLTGAVGLSAQERGIFVGAGLVETFLLAASIFGFVRWGPDQEVSD